MSDKYEFIREQIRHLGDVHGRVSMKDRIKAADTMQNMLDEAILKDAVVEAAQRWKYWREQGPAEKNEYEKKCAELHNTLAKLEQGDD